MCEKFFKSVDVKYRPMLMSFTDVKQTEQALQMLKGTVVRVVMNKARRQQLPMKKMKTGTMTEEKLDLITKDWKAYVQDTWKPAPDAHWEFVEREDPDNDLMAVPTVDGADIALGKAAEFLDQGYQMGTKVKVKKRVTGTVLTDVANKRRKCERKDVAPSSIGKICGFDAPTEHNLWVNFDVKGVTVKASVHVDNMDLVKKLEHDDKAKPGGRWAWLHLPADQPQTTVRVIEKWEQQSVGSADFINKRSSAPYKNMIAMALDMCLAQRQSFTSSDLCICFRNEKIEVWTMRSFSKGQLPHML